MTYEELEGHYKNSEANVQKWINNCTQAQNRHDELLQDYLKSEALLKHAQNTLGAELNPLSPEVEELLSKVRAHFKRKERK